MPSGTHVLWAGRPAQERLELSGEAIESIVRNANGDLRNALHSMQFVGVGMARRLGRAPARSGRGAGAQTKGQPRGAAAPPAATTTARAPGRDRFPDLFRTIGKILNQPAKRAKLRADAEQSARERDASAKEQLEPQQHRSSSESSDAPCAAEPATAEVDFAPEEVIQVRAPPPRVPRCDFSGMGDGGDVHMPHDRDMHRGTPGGNAELSAAPAPPCQSSALEEGMAAAFLHHNYPVFFSSIDDVADAAASLSDSAALLSAQRLRPWQPQLLPYVGSLAGRAVVTHNRQPAPSRFSQISKPQTFTVERAVLERRQQAVAAFYPPTRAGTTPADGVALQGERPQSRHAACCPSPCARFPVDEACFACSRACCTHLPSTPVPQAHRSSWLKSFRCSGYASLLLGAAAPLWVPRSPPMRNVKSWRSSPSAPPQAAGRRSRRRVRSPLPRLPTHSVTHRRVGCRAPRQTRSRTRIDDRDGRAWNVGRPRPADGACTVELAYLIQERREGSFCIENVHSYCGVSTPTIRTASRAESDGV